MKYGYVVLWKSLVFSLKQEQKYYDGFLVEVKSFGLKTWRHFHLMNRLDWSLNTTSFLLMWSPFYCRLINWTICTFFMHKCLFPERSFTILNYHYDDRSSCFIQLSFKRLSGGAVNKTFCYNAQEKMNHQDHFVRLKLVWYPIKYYCNILIG